MAIEIFVDDIESVDEGLRDDYVKGDDGRFVLKALAKTLEGYVSVDDIEKHEKTQGLVSALDKERESRREAERKTRELEAKNDGLTDQEKTELAALRKVKEEAEDKRKRQEGEFDKWREEIVAKGATETAELVKDRDGLRNFVCTSQVERDIAAACNEFGGRANILEPLVQRSVKAAYEDGAVSISVTDKDGTRLLDDAGKPLSIRGMVERMSTDKDFGDLFASKKKAGGGSSSEGGTGADDKGGTGETPSNLKRSEMSKTEKVAFIKEHGSEKFHALPLS